MIDSARTRPRIIAQASTPLGLPSMSASTSLHGQNGSRASRAKVNVTNVRGPSRHPLEAQASSSSLRTQTSPMYSGKAVSRTTSPSRPPSDMAAHAAAIISGPRLRAKVTSSANAARSTTPLASIDSSGRETPHKMSRYRDDLYDSIPSRLDRCRPVTASDTQSLLPSRQPRDEIAKGSKGPSSLGLQGEPLFGFGNKKARVVLETIAPMATNSLPSSEASAGPSTPLLPLNRPNRIDRPLSPVRMGTGEADVTSNRSSPRRSPSNLVAGNDPSVRFFPHPTASCPTSPVPGQPLPLDADRTRRLLPFNPHTSLPQRLPSPPDSPSLCKVDLPVITPPEDEMGFPNASTLYQQSPIAAVTVTLANVHSDLDEETARDATHPDVEEARINRKVADLEISNASLLAINRSLESTRARQSKEIARLRRALRESLTGSGPTASSKPYETERVSTMSTLSGQPEEDGEEDALDPELEERWSRLQVMVAGMRKRGEAAVEKGKEEIRVAGQRVLGWLETESVSANLSLAEDETGSPEPGD